MAKEKKLPAETKASRKETDASFTSAEDKSAYVSQQKAKMRKKYIRKQRRLRVWTVILILFMLVYVAVGAFALKYGQELLEGTPELNISDFVSEESSKIYDSRGNLITEIGTYYRENITYDRCPESLVDAFLSIEDSRYFQHNGFDIPRFTKAAIENVLHHDLNQGGSTFTMVMRVRNVSKVMLTRHSRSGFPCSWRDC